MFNNPTDANGLEKQIKGWSRKKKEALINEKYELLPGLSFNSKKRLTHTLRQAQSDNAQSDV
jgi:predicted GIY-YIG superfamily endonuclease